MKRVQRAGSVFASAVVWFLAFALANLRPDWADDSVAFPVTSALLLTWLAAEIAFALVGKSDIVHPLAVQLGVCYAGGVAYRTSLPLFDSALQHPLALIEALGLRTAEGAVSAALFLAFNVAIPLAVVALVHVRSTRRGRRAGEIPA